MNSGLLGYHLGGFAVAFAAGYVFLGLLWMIPPLRRNKKVWYSTAVVFVWMLGFVSISGYTLGHGLGAAAFTALAAWRASKAQPKVGTTIATPRQ